METILFMSILFVTSISRVLCNNGPVFVPGSTSTILIFPENTTINTVLGKLTARDYDGPQELKFSIPAGHPTGQTVKLSPPRGLSASPEGRTVDIILIAALDRDYTSSSNVKLRFVVEDNPGGEGNVIIQETTLYITDVNDEDPKFVSPRYEQDVLENATVGTIVTTVLATDPDQNDGGKVRYSMQPVGQAISNDYRNAFSIDPNNGEVRVQRKLDANIYNYYEYTLIATDGGGRAGQSVLLINIIDIQDKPPYFVNLPYSVSVQENAVVGSKILQMTALDGDRGRSTNTVSYSFVSGEYTNFDINSTTGWISVKSSLDADDPDLRQRGGVYAIIVKARENNNSQPDNLTTATTLVTITVLDVNDNSPVFNSPRYEAKILKNMQKGVPITFTGPGPIMFMNTSDIDQGENSHFQLTLEKDGLPYKDFAPLPSEVYMSSWVYITVNNSSALDYEKSSQVSFQIVAREIGTPERRSSTANVTVQIQDVSDNVGLLCQAYRPQKAVALHVSVQEQSPINTMLTTLNEINAGKPMFGNVTYHLRGSNQKFTVDERTGDVFTAAVLDRETTDSYLLTVEVRRDGKLITYVSLDIKVLDVNDGAPIFLRREQYVTVKEDSLEILGGDLVLVATDGDEPNTTNSMVRFRIKRESTGFENKFSINNSSGVLTMIQKIDYELVSMGYLEVEAFDLGIPPQSSVINITVNIQDVNDNEPKFFYTNYATNITDTATAGDVVLQVLATDADRTSPNNLVVYHIVSGSDDNFRIDPQTGEIMVEVGTDFKIETRDSYSLTVAATDRGATPLTGKCVVNITITR